MAVILMEGFDHLSTAQMLVKGWSSAGGAIAAGRFGGQALRSSNTVIQSHALPAAYSALFAGFALKLNVAPPSGATHFAFMVGTLTSVLRLQTVTSGPNKVFQLVNSAGTVLALGTTPLMVGVWYSIELKCVVSAAAGAVELRLDGSSVAECSAAGVNTGASNIDTVALVWANTITVEYDDLSVRDTTGAAPTNGFMGDYRVETVMPTAEGANIAWAANAGGKAAAVDDPATFDSDATYILDATPGDRETFTNAPLSIAGGTVAAVQVNLVARKDDAGARTIAPVIREAGVNYDGTVTPALTATYVVYSQLYDRLGPDGAAWTVASVNAMEVGVKEVT